MTNRVPDNMMLTPAVFAKYAYVSPNITITSGMVLPQAHGLPGLPSLIQAHLLCLTAEAGYSIGDNAIVRSSDCLFAADGTNITLMLQALPSVGNKATGVPVAITAANWKLVLRAWL